MNTCRSIEINWSFWDNSPTVSWSCDGAEVSVHLKHPPVAVVHLSKCGLIAVVGDYDKFGSANLLLYSYDGSIKKIFSAPAMEEDAQFGGVTENEDGVRAIVGFKSDACWKELAGQLDIRPPRITAHLRN
jgi:hypothetical protein